jgi:hypothetical protein
VFRGLNYAQTAKHWQHCYILHLEHYAIYPSHDHQPNITQTSPQPEQNHLAGRVQQSWGKVSKGNENHPSFD